MITLTIDRRTLTVPENTTLLAAARRLGIEIPTLCYRDDLDHVTSCMLCVVGDERTGERFPACSTPALAGMKIVTAAPEIIEARRTALELLLGDHLGDCEGPCRRACPAGLNIPVMLRKIAGGHKREAVAVVKHHIALPAVLGRICSAPCETVCRRAAHDAPLAIRRLKRFVADCDLLSSNPYMPDMADPSGLRVAVVGSGPAGLSAAFALRRYGHSVTIYEKQIAPGGGLRTVELRERLPLDVLDAEIDRILKLGIPLETGVEIGNHVSLSQLKQRFHAVILAVGRIDPQSVCKTYGLESGRHGIVTDRHTHRTGDPLVFACGNAMSSGRMAVRSVGQGQAAAIAVDRMLRDAPVIGVRHGYNHRIPGKIDAQEMAAFLADTALEERVVPADETDDAYDENEACREAARCLHCDCRKADACKLRSYADEYAARRQTWKPAQRRQVQIVRHGCIIYEPGKCIACGICVRIAEKAKEPFGLTFIGRGFDVRVGVPFNESLEQGLQTVAADCIAACPTGALAGMTAEERNRLQPQCGRPRPEVGRPTSGRRGPQETT